MARKVVKMISEDLEKKASHYASIFAMVPFVECLVLNGSVANNLATDKSDIDILVIVKPDWIFTARFGLNVLAALLRIKRPRDPNKDHAGKFCFNRFITSDHLSLERSGMGEQFAAQCYANTRLLWGDRVLFEKFKKVNGGWIRQLLSGVISTDASREWRDPLHFATKGFLDSQALLARNDKKKKGRDSIGCIRKMIEWLLAGTFGDLVERCLKAIQVRSIERHRRDQKYSDYIVVSDQELAFFTPKD